MVDFEIKTPSNTLLLNDKRAGEVSYSVTNLSGRALRCGVEIVPDNPIAAPWINLSGAADRVMPVAHIEQYTVQVSVPQEAPPGNYSFRLDAKDVDFPDESLVRGTSVAFTVKEVKVETTKIPTWLIILVAALILIITLILVIALINSISPTPAATATPTPTPIPTPFGGGTGEIVYVDTVGGQPAVFLINADGTNRRRIIGPEAASQMRNLGTAAWEPDGQRLAYICENAGTRRLCVLDLAINPPTSDEIGPGDGILLSSSATQLDWLPNGSIVHGCQQSDAGVFEGMCTTNVSSGRTRRFFNQALYFPNMSPDGTEIVGLASGSGQPQIAIVNLDGEGMRSPLPPLPTPTPAPPGTPSREMPVLDLGADWSPDGTQLVVATNRFGPFSLVVINAATGAIVRTVAESTADRAMLFPEWSPDGNQVLAMSDCVISDDLGGCNIASYAVDGSGSRTIVNAPGSQWGARWRPAAR